MLSESASFAFVNPFHQKASIDYASEGIKKGVRGVGALKFSGVMQAQELRGVDVEAGNEPLVCERVGLLLLAKSFVDLSVCRDRDANGNGCGRNLRVCCGFG